MVTSNSNIADVCGPSSGAVNASRRDAQSQSSQDSFGDALKGQMNSTSDTRQSAPKTTSGGNGTNATNGSQPTDNSAKSDGSSQQVVAKDDNKAGQSSGKGSASRDKKNDKKGSVASTQANVPPSAAPADVAAATPADAGTAPGQVGGTNMADSGKSLPSNIELAGGGPQASGTVSSAAQLPDWLQSMGMLSMESGGASSNGVNADGQGGDSGTTTALQGTTPDGNGLLKELQAMAGGSADKGGKNSDASADQNTNSDVLLKLIGDTGSKNVSALSQPQATGAAATGAPNTLLSTPPSGPAAPATPPQLAVGVPVNQPGWDQAVSERVVWLATQGMQQASIQLHPKNMGPIEVHIALHKDDASIAFVAHHPATREAIQAAMPKLRDMMQQSGLNLAQSDVSHQSFSQQHQGRSASHNIRGGLDSPLDGIGATGLSGEISLHSGVLLGAVDYYA